MDLVEAEKSVEKVEQDLLRIIEDIHSDMQDLNREQDIDNFMMLTSIERKECCERMKRFLPIMRSRFPESESWDLMRRLLDEELALWEKLKDEGFEQDTGNTLSDIKQIIIKQESLLAAAGKEAANKKATAHDVEKFLSDMKHRQAL